MATKNPVTVGGWYENTDGTWTQYYWINGVLHEGASAAEPPSYDDADHLDERDAGLRDPRGQG